MINQSNADTATLLSISSAVVSIANFQPVVTMAASIVAIISGISAIRYYWKVTKKLDK